MKKFRMLLKITSVVALIKRMIHMANTWRKLRFALVGKKTWRIAIFLMLGTMFPFIVVLSNMEVSAQIPTLTPTSSSSAPPLVEEDFGAPLGDWSSRNIEPHEEYHPPDTGVAQIGELLYEDDFSDPTSGWPTWDDEDSSGEYLRGEYRLRVKRTRWYVGTTPGRRFTEFALDVDGRFASAPIGAYAVLFGITDNWDWYGFWVSSDGYYAIYKHIGATNDWQTLQDWTFSSLINRGQVSNQLRAIREGSQIIVYVNGEHLSTVIDNSFTGSLRVGLAAMAFDQANVDARFDNLRVYALEGATPAPTSSSTTTPTSTRTPTLTETPAHTPTPTYTPAVTPTPTGPCVTCCPKSAPAGVVLHFMGSGFVPNELVHHWLEFPGIVHYDIPVLSADEFGAFHYYMWPESSWPQGTCTYCAMGTRSLVRVCDDLTITPSKYPTVTVCPPFGPPGAIFWFSGTNFTPREPLVHWFTEPDGTRHDLGTTNAEYDGTFLAVWEFPVSWPVGTYTYTVEGCLSHKTASIDFEITEMTPAPSATPTSTPTRTPTTMRTATATSTSSPTPTNTPTPAGTATPTRTPTTMRTATATSTSSPTPTSTPTPTGTTTPTATPGWRYVSLPIILRIWPPIPDIPNLYLISNPDGDGNYTVSWNAAARATGYILEEDDNDLFSSPSVAYSGPGTSTAIVDRAPGTYYYRVKATNSWGDSGWSEVKSVTVMPPTPTPTRIPTNTPPPGLVLPQPGSWRGSRSSSFTVTSDYKIHNFSITVPFSTGSCRLRTVQDIPIGDVGYHASLALDQQGHPHVSYYDLSNSDLKYARRDGSRWIIQTVDSDDTVGLYTSLALDAAGDPHIGYYDSSDSDLKYACWNGSRWVIQTVDSDGSIGLYTSLALDAAGNPHISYLDGTNDDLKYVRWDGSRWVIQTVDSDGMVGWDTSLALDAASNPHISYYDLSNSDLKYARWDGSCWVIQTVDSDGTVGLYTSLALDAAGNPHISYYDSRNGDLKYAHWDGSHWVVQTVDSTGRVGWFSSLALDAASNPHISYYDSSNRDLKYAVWAGNHWNLQVVDSSGDQGGYSSLDLDVAGNPQIAYHDAIEGDLRYARWTGSAWSLAMADSILSNHFIIADINEITGVFKTSTHMKGTYVVYLCGSTLIIPPSQGTWTADWAGSALSVGPTSSPPDTDQEAINWDYLRRAMASAQDRRVLPGPRMLTTSRYP